MTPDSLSIAKEEQKGWSRQDIDYVPVLDLADYLEGKPDAFEKLVEDLRFAQENIGFYYITNHGVDQALIDETFHPVARFHALPLEQIGRASCRERLCQYVSISVVAVSLKKK